MDLKYIWRVRIILKLIKTSQTGNDVYNYIKNIIIRGGILMLKFLSKLAEKYSKSTNSACLIISFLHQPKMPKSLIKED